MTLASALLGLRHRLLKSGAFPDGLIDYTLTSSSLQNFIVNSLRFHRLDRTKMTG